MKILVCLVRRNNLFQRVQESTVTALETRSANRMISSVVQVEYYFLLYEAAPRGGLLSIWVCGNSSDLLHWRPRVAKVSSANRHDIGIHIYF